MTMATSIVRPDRTKLFGVTHANDGTALRRQTRSLKVGIGVPKGPDVHVWLGNSGAWIIEVGEYDDKGKRSKGILHKFGTRKEAEDAYREFCKTTRDRKFPAKLPYFTFLRVNADGRSFKHDFDAIAAHGAMPTVIDIFFTVDSPFVASYEWWSASQLNCWGDGNNALRRVELAKTDDEKRLAKDPIDERYFPIIGGCAEGGCPECVENDSGKRNCRPHGKLVLQLANAPSIGSTCTFDTTGFRSTQQIHSSLMDIKEATGNGDPDRGHLAGIPLKLVLRPYTASPNGNLTTLYAVNVEFHPPTPEDAKQITQAMIRYASTFRATAPQIAAPVPAIEAPAWTEDEEAAEATVMAAEFYTESEQNTPEAASEIANRKKEELKAKGAKVTEITKDQTPSPVVEDNNNGQADDSWLPDGMTEGDTSTIVDEMCQLYAKLAAAGRTGFLRQTLEKHGVAGDDPKNATAEQAIAIIADMEDNLRERPIKPKQQGRFSL